MVRDLEESIHRSADAIIDQVIEKGRADFVTDLSAELPLQVIAELLGVPQEDRHRMFDWSNQMVGSEDPEYQLQAEMAMTAAMELYAYAAELFGQEADRPPRRPHERAHHRRGGRRAPQRLELELFFLLLTVAGNETTRNLMSGAMHAFFQYPEQWQRLRTTARLLPTAVEEMLRFVTPVMNFRRTAMCDTELSGTPIPPGDKVVFFHASGNRDEDIFENPDPSTSAATPTPHRLRWRRAPLLPGRQPGPHGDPGDVRAPARPAARHPARRRRAAPAVPVHQWGQAPSGSLHPDRPRRRLSRPPVRGGGNDGHDARPTR
jgi:cholest-4-en-3-one 26-monooxygenase